MQKLCVFTKTETLQAIQVFKLNLHNAVTSTKPLEFFTQRRCNVGVFPLSMHMVSTSKPTGYKHPTLHYVMQRE